jgi:WhiB family redox-sensing transcriptional regulator
MPNPPSDLSWQLDAACVDVEPELFYASEGRPGSRRQVIEAVKVCRVCPVVDACAEWAFETNDQWAVLGGLSPRQRQKSRAAWRAGKDIA